MGAVGIVVGDDVSPLHRKEGGVGMGSLRWGKSR